MDLKNLKLSRKDSVWLVIMLFPVLVFFINLAIFSVNIPYNDDYPIAYIFMFHFLDSKTWLEQFNLLVTMLDNHHQLFSKLIIILQYYLFGDVNVRLMQFIGNAGLLVIAWLLFRMFHPDSDKIKLFVPVLFMLFQTGYAENSFFGVAALTNFYVMVIGYLSIYLLNKRFDSWTFSIIAFLLSILAYFTQENGILFLGTGIFMLLIRKEWKKSVLWFTLSIPVIFFYRYYTGDLSHWNFGQTVNWGILKINPLFFFYFIGNCFGASFSGQLSREGGTLIIMISRIVPLSAGILITAYFIYLCFTGYYKKNPALSAVFIFLILTAFGAMIERGGALGLNQAITSRYRIVSIQFIILTYLSLCELLGNKVMLRRFFAVSLICSILYCGLIYIIKYEPIVRHRENLIVSLNKWVKTGHGLYPLADEFSDESDKTLLTAVKRGLYRIPNY